MNDLHIEISEILIACAKKRTIIPYSELYTNIDHLSRWNVGDELEKISLFTNSRYGIFLSVLVVQKTTQQNKIPMPGDGFVEMYHRIRGRHGIDDSILIKEEREKAFNEDWSNLIEEIREEIKHSR